MDEGRNWELLKLAVTQTTGSFNGSTSNHNEPSFRSICPDMVDVLLIINSFMRLRPDDKVERMNIYRLLDLDDGGEQWANTLLRDMGVLDVPSIVKGFKNSLKTLNRKHVPC